MSSITILKAGINDLETIQNIGIQTFSETFSESNPEEAMKNYLEKSFSTEKVKSELNHADSHFYIAWEEDIAVGYLKLNSGSAQTELQDDTAMEIERIYVKKSHHGQKVGQLLYDQALETAKSFNKQYLWLGVWEKNPRAIRFYEKNGFEVFGNHTFRLGDDEQTDLMMKKILK